MVNQQQPYTLKEKDIQVLRETSDKTKDEIRH